MLEITRAISEYGILLVIAGIFLWFYITDKKSWQKSQDKMFERSNEINDKLTSIISANTVKVDEHSNSLNRHSDESKHSFDDLNQRVDRIDNKVDKLQATTKELATKEMAEEIKEELKNLKR